EYDEDGKDLSLSEVKEELAQRDRQDRNRDIAPLRRAEDATLLDTTYKTIDDQIAFVVDRVKEYRPSGT
ncbi:MAG: cytidylate kinase, partial [Bacteroidetes bacterium QH_1_61_8]